MASLVEAVQARAAEQLTLPEGVEPSKELPRFKRFLKDESSRLKNSIEAAVWAVRCVGRGRR